MRSRNQARIGRHFSRPCSRLRYQQRAAEDIYTVDERVAHAADWLAAEAAKLSAITPGPDTVPPATGTDPAMEAFRAELACGIGAPAGQVSLM